MRKVNVLMSTYNGERYMREQIDSVLAQDNVSVDLLVRDDGSTDNTLKLLDAYQGKGALKYYVGANLGPALSFLALLRDSGDADYYAFADQDDFWQREKLAVAVDMLEKAGDAPALYFSRTQMTDAELRPTGIVEINPLLTFGESLVYEFIPGCTMVMNRALRDIVNTYVPSYVPMHDVWVYSVALAVGAKVFFDKTPHILYRQHGSNTIGQGYSVWHEWHRRYKRLVNAEHSRYRRACEIEKGFGKLMPSSEYAVLHDFIVSKQSFLKRLRLCFDRRLVCANRNTKLLFDIAVLLNIY